MTAAANRLDARVGRCTCGAYTFDGDLCGPCLELLEAPGGLFSPQDFPLDPTPAGVETEGSPA